jgi:hypothetical protein
MSISAGAVVEWLTARGDETSAALIDAAPIVGADTGGGEAVAKQLPSTRPKSKEKLMILLTTAPFVVKCTYFLR